MPEIYSATSRSIKQGDIVVSLNDIIKQLGSKLSQNDIESLLYAILSRRKEEVRPGDLITADLMNQVLAELADLQIRVADLETSQPASKQGVIISEPNPNTILAIGDRLVIKGQNLLADSVVEIDKTPLIGFIGNADNTMLTLESIKPIGTIFGKGHMAELHVSNSAGTADAKFWLKPRELTAPIGSLLLAQTGGPLPAPVNGKYQAGTSYTFIFTITADTRPDETFKLIPTVDAGWKAQYVDSHDKPISPSEVLIAAAAGPNNPTVKEVRIQVVIPASAQRNDTGKLTLQAVSKRAPALVSPPQAISITVEGVPEKPRNMSLKISSSAGDAGWTDNSDGTQTAFVVPSSNNAELIFTVIVPASGQYKIDTAKLKSFLDDQSAMWSASVPGAVNGDTVTLKSPSDQLNIAVLAKNDAGKAKMVLEITSASHPDDSGYLELAVEPLII